MSNYVTCGKAGISFETLLGALIVRNDTLSANNFINVTVYLANVRTEPISCSTKDSFYELFQRALELDTDGRPSLRIILQTADADDDVCNVGEQLEDALRMCFARNESGDVCLMLMSNEPAPQ